MKKIVVSILLTGSLCSAVAQQTKTPPASAAKPAGKKVVLKNLLDSFSYAAGYSVANNMKQQNIRRLNTAMMQKAMDDVFNNRPVQLGGDQLAGVFQRQTQVFAAEKSKEDKIKATGEINRGNDFLATNKLRKGVNTLASGLQYEILTRGDSTTAMPKQSDTVVVNYVGSLVDGKEFQSSYKMGKPAVFKVTEVIRGWSEILQLMRVGDKWKVYVPTELAYYMNPPTPEIPQGAALIFEISLEGIKPAPIQ